jgi:hypothetical protein
MLEGAREIIGQAGVNAVLNRAQVLHRQYAKANDLVANTGDIQTALEDLYGLRGGRGVALRSGRVSFDQLLRMDGKEMGLMELNYRMLPSQARIFMGLQLLADKISSMMANAITVEDGTDAWQWRMTADVQLGQERGMRSSCHFLVGFLQEYLMWASGGKYHHVQEVECGIGEEQTCMIRLEKNSL